MGSSCGLSFSGDTRVATPDGPRAIAGIRTADKVLAYDPDTREVLAQSVEQVFVSHDSDRMDVTLATVGKTSDKRHGVGTAESATESHSVETIHTTANHPWLTADRGWVDAGALEIGEPVQLAGESIAYVEDLQSIPGIGTMYDLGLGQVHTFLVGAALFVVHNCSASLNDAAFSDQRLFRFGLPAETADELGKQAAAAEAQGFPHGISVVDRSNRLDAVSALRSEIERYFNVVKTGRSPHHYTMVLPKPVTQDVADRVNQLFDRRLL